MFDASPFMRTPTTALWGAAFTMMLIRACDTDIRQFKIPNALVGWLVTGGLLYAAVRPGSFWINMSDAVTAALLGLLLWLPFYATRWLGAGDVKLFAAASIWLGPAATINATIIAVLIGGVASLLWMIATLGARGTVFGANLVVASPQKPARAGSFNTTYRVPYGFALTIGLLAVAWLPNAFLLTLYGAHRAIHR